MSIRDVSGELRTGPDEDALDAFRDGEGVSLNVYGELYELSPAEADELGMQLIYAAARAKEKRDGAVAGNSGNAPLRGV